MPTNSSFVTRKIRHSLNEFPFDHFVDVAGEEGEDEENASDKSIGTRVVAEFAASVAENHQGGEGNYQGKHHVQFPLGRGVADFAGLFGGDVGFLLVTFDHFEDVERSASGLIPNVVFEALVVFDAVQVRQGDLGDEFECLRPREGLYFEFFEVGDEAGVLYFDLSGRSEDVEMILQLLQINHLAAGEVAQIVEDQGILLRAGDLDEEFHEAFGRLLSDHLLNVLHFEHSLGDGLLVVLEQVKEHTCQHLFGVSHIIYAEDFALLVVVQQMRFADALGTEEDDVDFLFGQVHEFGDLYLSTHVKFGSSLFQRHDVNPFGWKNATLELLEPGTRIDGLDGLAQFLVFDVEVDFGGLLAVVAKEFLGNADVVAFPYHTCREGVPQHVWVYSSSGILLDPFPNHHPAQVKGFGGFCCWKNVGIWLRVFDAWPVVGEGFEQSSRQRNGPGAEALAALFETGYGDSVLHEIEVLALELHHFGNPQATIQHQEDDDAVLEVFGTRQCFLQLTGHKFDVRVGLDHGVVFIA